MNMNLKVDTYWPRMHGKWMFYSHCHLKIEQSPSWLVALTLTKSTDNIAQLACLVVHVIYLLIYTQTTGSENGWPFSMLDGAGFFHCT